MGWMSGMDELNIIMALFQKAMFGRGGGAWHEWLSQTVALVASVDSVAQIY